MFHTTKVLNDRYIIVLGLTEEEGEISDNSDEEVEEDSEKIPYVVIDLYPSKLREKLIIPRTPVYEGGEFYGENLMWSVVSSTVKEAEIDDWWVAKDLIFDEKPQLYTHPYPEDLYSH